MNVYPFLMPWMTTRRTSCNQSNSRSMINKVYIVSMYTHTVTQYFFTLKSCQNSHIRHVEHSLFYIQITYLITEVRQFTCVCCIGVRKLFMFYFLNLNVFAWNMFGIHVFICIGDVTELIVQMQNSVSQPRSVITQNI